MTPHSQTASQQNELAYSLQLWKILRSKKDIEHYTHALRTIYSMTENESIKSTAAEFLQQQLKLRSIMNDLIERLRKSRQNEGTTSNHQFEQEIEIFDEMHYQLKKQYYAFVTQHFSPAPFNQGTLVA